MTPSPFREQLVNELTAMGYAIDDVRKADTFTPPEGVQAAARRALKLIADGHAGDGFTDVGRKRASDLAAGRAVSLDTVKRMRSYFARHAVDKQGKDWGSSEKPSPGKVAWLAWGGDPGKSWADAIVRRQNNIEKAYKRKFATREEAARFAANARWGNRAKTEDGTSTGQSADSPKWKPLQTVDEIHEEWIRRFPHMDVRFETASVEVANEVAATFVDLADQYPEVALRIAHVGDPDGMKAISPSGWYPFGALGDAMNYGNGSGWIRMNGVKSSEDFTRSKIEAAESGFQVKGVTDPQRMLGGHALTGARAVMTHEFGHHVDFWLADKTKGSAKPQSRAIYSARMKAKKVINEELAGDAKTRGLTSPPPKLKIDDALALGLSRYGNTNPKETFAEAFTEYQLSTNPRFASREIIKQTFENAGLPVPSMPAVNAIAKAYKRKYATREEAARAAANARWGNRTPKVDAPVTPTGPKIDPWVDQKSAAAVDKEFNRRWGNRTLMRTTGLPPEAANGVAETMNELLTLYPDTTLHLVGTQTGISQMIRSGTYPPGTPESVMLLASRGRYPRMQQNDGGDYTPQLQFIRINKNHYGADGYGAISTQISETSEWFTPTGHPSGSTRHAAKRSMVHEFAHAIDFDPKNRARLADYTQPDNPIAKATRKATGAAPTGASYDAFIRTNVGTYAGTNSRELFAETFTEYHMNPAARSLSVDFVKFRMAALGVPLSRPSDLNAIEKAYKRKYATRREAAQAAANARWGNKGAAAVSAPVDNAVFNPSYKEMLAGKTASGRKLRNSFSGTPINGYTLETDTRPFGSAPEHLKRGALLRQGTSQALWQVTSVKGDIMRSKPVYDRYGRKVYKPGTSQSLHRQYWDSLMAVKGNAADLPEQDDAIAKAYKRKYATRAEAARAAANARWGNRTPKPVASKNVNWQQLETIDEINSAWNDKYGDLVPGGFDGMAVRFARQAAGGLDLMFQQYPDVAADLSFVGSTSSPLYRPSVQKKTGLSDSLTANLAASLPNNCFGGTSMKYGYIVFSEDSDNTVQDAFSMNQYSNWVVPTRLNVKAGEYIAVHEFGHAVARHMGKQSAGNEMWMSGVQDVLNQGSDVAWQRVMPLIVEKTEFGRGVIRSENISKSLSEYGAADQDEAFAESWAEIHLNDNPRPYATTWVKGFAEGLGVPVPSSAVAKAYDRKYAITKN